MKTTLVQTLFGTLAMLGIGMATPETSQADYTRAQYEISPYRVTMKAPGYKCVWSATSVPDAKLKVSRAEKRNDYLYNWHCAKGNDKLSIYVHTETRGSAAAYRNQSTTVPASVTVKPKLYMWRNGQYCGMGQRTITRTTPRYAYKNQVVQSKRIISSSCGSDVTFEWVETMRRVDWR